MNKFKVMKSILVATVLVCASTWADTPKPDIVLEGPARPVHDTSLPPAKRVMDLVQRMTLDEKIAYLGGTGMRRETSDALLVYRRPKWCEQ